MKGRHGRIVLEAMPDQGSRWLIQAPVVFGKVGNDACLRSEEREGSTTLENVAMAWDGI